MNNSRPDDILNQPIMRLNANALKGPVPTKGNLNRIIIDLIRDIESKIKEADNEGKTAISYDTTGDFAVPHMEPKDIQTFVYSSILKELHNNNFVVAFRNSPNNYTFFIKWKSEFAKHELQNRAEIINIASVRFKNERQKIILNKSGSIMQSRGTPNSKPLPVHTLQKPQQQQQGPSRQVVPPATAGSTTGNLASQSMPEEDFDNLDWSELLGTN
jgi:hypothetical protein